MSEFYVGITDTDWLNFVMEDYKNSILPSNINFWTPGTKGFNAIKKGEMLLFKLHRRKSTGENGEIVGGGFFLRYEKMSIMKAWDKYERGNGFESFEKMKESVTEMQSRNNVQYNHEIGCIILEKVFFFDEYIEEPKDWDKHIVSGKTYSCDIGAGFDLYEKLKSCNMLQPKTDDIIIDEIEKGINENKRKGEDKKSLVKIRVNQSVFRNRLLKRYHSCCLCNVENTKLLVASHIKPWAESEATEKLDVDNGFLFCPNHDALFDGGYISFGDDGKIIISNRLSENDRKLTNVSLDMSVKLTEKNKKYLEYHRENVFH